MTVTENKETPAEEPVPEGQLRWVLPNPDQPNPTTTRDEWHLSWGHWSRLGPITVCGHGLGNPTQRALGDFMPSKRCPVCASTIRMQLGL